MKNLMLIATCLSYKSDNNIDMKYEFVIDDSMEIKESYQFDAAFNSYRPVYNLTTLPELILEEMRTPGNVDASAVIQTFLNCLVSQGYQASFEMAQLNCNTNIGCNIGDGKLHIKPAKY